MAFMILELLGASMGVHFIRGCAVAVICAIGGAAPSAAEPLFFTKDSILFFGGRFTSGNTDGALSIVGAHYESNYIVGGAFRREFLKLGWGFTVGGEAGIAGRFGDSNGAEFWGGPFLRHEGLSIGSLTISPSIVGGLSAVTSPIGVERVREVIHGGDATLLFYLGLELAASFKQLPNWEFVYRLHHRSGAEHTLGNLVEGSNANTIGARYIFPPASN